mmetsp:Transcript_8072/g.18422  ORF Transcript_8072/g.18422 Transcript_8072/m.18422 type:complete len:329 (+) Transcript_8072:388-1374(+)
MDTSDIIDSSTVAPKMMFASGSTALMITSDAALISDKLRSEPPTTLKTIPLAWRTGNSRRGESIASMAANRARSGPVADPIPINAVPELRITLFTSAKSTLISPGRTMISLMPTTPMRKMSSATRKASCSGVSLGTICKRRSFDTTMRVSTSARSFSIASLACFIRRPPSNPKGLVTTPTVSAPCSLAICATTGAAPDPVPPPMPAVTKTMSEPLTIFAMSSLDSSAALLPTSGSPPAPSPRVTLAPIFNVLGALLLVKACASVLIDQKVTPIMFVSTMRLTALPPPPPTPMTLITHGEACAGSEDDETTSAASLIWSRMLRWDRRSR